MLRTILLLAFIGLAAAACGRRADPAYPSDAIAKPAELPKRGGSVLYPY
jgi:hypothetical protein